MMQVQAEYGDLEFDRRKLWQHLGDLSAHVFARRMYGGLIMYLMLWYNRITNTLVAISAGLSDYSPGKLLRSSPFMSLLRLIWSK
jgi:pimeloyl-ACP methyl ester carboxylesterase